MNWRDCRVGDLCKVGRGSSPRPKADPRYFEGGTIPWIKVADATASGKYLLQTKEHVNQFGASFSRLLPVGSLIICTSGTLGLSVILGIEGCIHDGWLYTYDYRNLDTEFFYYFLQTQRRYFASRASGAAIQNINTDILRDTPIRLPPLDAQARIAGILKTYDDLIENNRRRIALLEEAARMLYREWFLRFHFPGHEHVKIIDGIPEGWERRVLDQIVDVVSETVKPSDFRETDVHIGLEHIPRRSFVLPDWETIEGLASHKMRFRNGDILFGKIRPNFHKVGFALRDGLASSDALVWRVRNDSDWPMAVCGTSSDHFVAVASKTVREGSKMPRADWSVLKNYVIPKPPDRLLRVFNETIFSVTRQCRTLALASRALAQARDLLLPRLMSGEIAV